MRFYFDLIADKPPQANRWLFGKFDFKELFNMKCKWVNRPNAD
jgi:hypothetical protein